MAAERPTLLILAGANGSGKTTIAERLIPHKRFKDFINADEIARGLSPFDPTSQRIEAGRITLQRQKDCINQNKSFAIETTLSGKSLAQLIKLAKQNNYQIQLMYIYISDIRVNLNRIKERVQQGGHAVPVKDAKRRYLRSLNNLFHIYYDLCDIISLYDNTEGAPHLIAFKPSHEQGLYVTNVDTWKNMMKLAGFKDETE